MACACMCVCVVYVCIVCTVYVCVHAIGKGTLIEHSPFTHGPQKSSSYKVASFEACVCVCVRKHSQCVSIT